MEPSILICLKPVIFAWKNMGEMVSNLILILTVRHTMLCTMLFAFLVSCGGGGADIAASSAAMVPALPTSNAGLGAASGAKVTADGMSPVSYTESAEMFPNPERGFYNGVRHCDSDAFNLATLTGYRVNDANTLLICVFYLSNFKTSPISAAALDFFQRQMDVVRAAGLKVILRFAYTENEVGDDADLKHVLQHLDQLAPYLAKNDDVIAFFQQGFIGAWGEGAYSIHFGRGEKLNAQNIADRKAVLEKTLAVVPANRTVQLRTPSKKISLLGGTPLQPSEAFSGSARARVGQHNDCFLKGDFDTGTYNNVATEYPYLAAETKYVPMGGETCGLSPPRTDCPTALSELKKFHWTYLNLKYDPAVLDRWRAQSCFNQIKQKLGYRLVLQTGHYSSRARAGGRFDIRIDIKNVGWAAPVNARDVNLVLRNVQDGRVYRFRLDADPRSWQPAQVSVLSQSITLPATMPSGRYALLLGLPDAAASLAARPEYAIALANDKLWEPATGLNSLNYFVSVGE